MAPLHLTEGELERLNSRSLIFGSFVTRGGAALRQMLLININNKQYMENPVVAIHFILGDLELSKLSPF